METRIVVIAGLVGITACVLLLLSLSPVPSQRTYTLYQVRAGWAGYAVNATRGNEATFVNGTWTVPGSHCSADRSSVLVWIGLGGNTGGSIEQIGTRNDCVDGRPSYSAWYELWPQQPDTVTLPGFKVGPGDNVSASVAYSNSTKVYKFFIGDGSETDSFSPSYANSSVSSAEWIVEAPGFLNGTRLPLSNFSAVHFGESFATISSHTNAITGFGGQSFSNLYERTYVCNNETRAQPGPVTIGGADFTVTWLGGAGCPQ